MKIYLGGPMFVAAEVRYNLWLAALLREHGYEVYCPNESEPINDKTRTDITPRKVYEADREALESANVYLCQVSEDSGTNWEAGYFDCLSRYVDPNRYYGVIGLATDIRLNARPNPDQVGVENMAWSINAFVVGGLQESLGIVRTEDDLLARLREIAASRGQR
ncbi:MAG TPA: nucleoside 2-deoxyribosyltransferase [Thermomicrobiales bacterium]|nr:nucleoside 2-deoxyribosyltransferase [Thermomicrobiales bacterium]